MSEVFEGLVLRADSATNVLDSELPIFLERRDLPGALTVLYRDDVRRDSAFSSQMEQIAERASRHGGQVLLVRYDSRIGHRSSALFANGRRERAFGETDELYVPLDETGEPIANARQLRIAELNPKEEYETIANAIEIGLRELGGGDWSALFDLMTHPQ